MSCQARHSGTGLCSTWAEAGRVEVRGKTGQRGETLSHNEIKRGGDTSGKPEGQVHF